MADCDSVEPSGMECCNLASADCAPTEDPGLATVPVVLLAHQPNEMQDPELSEQQLEGVPSRSYSKSAVLPQEEGFPLNQDAACQRDSNEAKDNQFPSGYPSRVLRYFPPLASSCKEHCFSWVIYWCCLL